MSVGDNNNDEALPLSPDCVQRGVNIDGKINF